MTYEIIFAGDTFDNDTMWAGWGVRDLSFVPIVTTIAGQCPKTLVGTIKEIDIQCSDGGTVPNQIRSMNIDKEQSANLHVIPESEASRIAFSSVEHFTL